MSPKRFAGLFSAAPAVAIAGLAIVLVDQGHDVARAKVRGMIAGGVGMAAYATVVVPLLRRRTASIAAASALGAWLLVATAVALPLFLG